MTLLVLVEHRNGQIKKVSFEAVKAASNIAAELSATVIALACGTVSGLEQLGAYGAAKVLHASDARLDQYSTTAYAAVVSAAVAAAGADAVFLSATALGKDLAPAVAVGIDGGLAPDVTSLRLEGGAILATRPVFAGKALETVKINAPKQVFSLRPNVFSAGAPSDATAAVEAFDAGLTDKHFRVRATSVSVSSAKLDVAEADIIVTGGRGMQAPENWHLIEDLAGVLGAATGASRAVVDAGWRPHAEQVGQTGKTVSPSLYIACGVSGAVQHLAGMSSSKVIVAINKDKDAPIFQAADYGIVGDVFEVLPALTAAVRAHQGK
ncbi:MAG: electron transfer flavoprotein subunit alpha/FixB family protein [Ignavibacteriae bacterium]|nr:electron transfer flavoprotein subunit alpha/FixB family protein [Ignavibacteriota bacterium]